MHLVACASNPTEQDVDALVIGVTADDGSAGQTSDQSQHSALSALDELSGQVIRRLREHGDFSGDANELVKFPLPPSARARWAVLVGLGPSADASAPGYFRAAATAAKALATKPGMRVGFHFPSGHAASGIAGAMVGCVGQDLLRAKQKLNPLAEIRWSGAGELDLARGRQLGESINLTRKLVNLPPNHVFPESFASTAQEVADEVGLGIEIWDQKRLEAERCGSLLAVAQGSINPPRLVILRYQGASESTPWTALVGKGVTFDSGGYSLKPSDGMKDMKCDMAGAATVLGAMRAIALAQPKANVIGICGLVENMVSGGAYKLGDVLRARSGKTIEVLNTDAEGRLVLADCLDVACSLGAERIIDLATLTGACMVALGNDVAGLMTNNDSLASEVKESAARCGEPLWELPMFAEYGEQITSPLADIKNVGNGRWGGAITAAKFLEEFVQKRPWVHLDIAGPAYADSSKAWIDGGASGIFVRTLLDFVEHSAG